MNDNQDRIQQLEEQIAYQAAEIETLSDQVREQWQRIDNLMEALGRFRDRLTEVEEAGAGPHVITKPPHY